MKLLLCILCTLCATASGQIPHMRDVFSYQPVLKPQPQNHPVVLSSDIEVMETFFVTTKGPLPLSYWMEKDMEDRFGDFYDKKTGDVGTTAVLPDSEFGFRSRLSEYVTAGAKDIKRLRDGFEVDWFRGTKTTLYVRSGVSWHVQNSKYKTVTLRPSRNELFKYNYAFRNFGDAWDEGVINTVKNLLRLP